MNQKLSKLRTSGIFLALSGAILFSAKAVFIKLAYQYEVSSISLLLIRMLSALPLYALVGLYQQRKKHSISNTSIRPVDYLHLVLLGCIGYYLASYLDFMGLKYISASLERLILFVYPTIVVILSALFLKQRIHPYQAMAIVITYLGMFIIFSEHLDLTQNQNFWFGTGLIFLSAFTYASYLVGSGELIKRIGSISFTTYAMIVACICVIIHNAFVADVKHLFDLPLPVYLYGVLMGIFCTVIPSYIISEAIQRLGASNMSIIAGIGPVSTITLSAIFLGERLSIIQLLGALVVIIGIFMVSRSKKDKSLKVAEQPAEVRR
ncbi:DMT family transporter [Algivirga pacifica]|uniref:DMT family transporter n=1 Tax=Algivirga pacifica TaxID=1162670 RepID=A0ABP9D604_9BACT